MNLQEEKGSIQFCTQCGAKNKAEAAFCVNCGAKLDKAQTAQVQKRKKPIPRTAIILPVCVLVIGIAVFAALRLRDGAAPDKSAAPGSGSPGADRTVDTAPTPFTEYLALVGGDCKELYSDEYKVSETGDALGQYTAYTKIPFMDIDGTGCFRFYHAEDEETRSALEKSGGENNTVRDFRWSCDASVHSLDDVYAGFASVYGDAPLHGTYSLGSLSGDRQVESYCWENVEGGYDLELSLEADAAAIHAVWSASPDVEGSYEDVVSTFEKALEERDASAYERLLYKNAEDPSDSSSAAEELAEILSGGEADRIDCYIGDTVKAVTYFDMLISDGVMSGNYSIASSDLRQVRSLYFVNADLIFYQNENIVAGGSCRMDIAYMNGEWKILGMSQNSRYSDAFLVQLAKQYYEAASGNTPPNVEVDHYEGDLVVIHIYEMNDNATATWDWYTIDPHTLEGTDLLGNEVKLYEAFDGEGQ